MDKEKEEQQKNRKISEVSKASQEHEEEEEDEEDEDEQTSSDPVPVPVLPIHRKSSYGFDEYKFQGTVLEENETAKAKVETASEKEAEKFLELAKFKRTDYSKVDVLKIASQAGGLTLDESLVEPVAIVEDPDRRIEAVRAIYGPDVKPESEPFQDPVKSLEVTPSREEDPMPERIRSPPNLYEALQSNFLRSNYKTSIYRLFLLGTHDENLSHFIEWNKDLIDQINVQSYTESLQGVLCVYEYYYIHVVEGSEDNLSRLMHRYASDLEPSGYEWSLKFHIKTARYSARKDPVFQTIQSWVLGIFRINERQFNVWRGEKVFPNRMQMSDIVPGGFREKYFHFIRQCMVMAFTYNRMAPGTFNPAPEGTNEETTSQMKKAIERAKIQRFKSLGKVVTPITFIQYVLDHKDNPKLKIRSIREHLELFGATPAYISSSNTDWPPPGRIAPYD